eukprot:TRINITY_DN1891_c0_g1_i2.p1 TRINITY_DN1891_c0_g1~~TRINITY_DN1891_c0_g1_i2.p1  ORF type:complete len:132 (+),score=6.79 TRINITY_DN1891_c0_g1_i2:138-533(+)
MTSTSTDPSGRRSSLPESSTQAQTGSAMTSTTIPSTSTTQPSEMQSSQLEKPKLTPSQVEDAQPGLSYPVSMPPKVTQLEKISQTKDPYLLSSKTSTATTTPTSKGATENPQVRRGSQPGQDTTEFNRTGA